MKTVQHPVERPRSAEEQWERHCAQQRRKSLGRSVVKIGVVVSVAMFLLILLGAPLAMS